MILSAQSIRMRCTDPWTSDQRHLVYPFFERTVENGKTYGLSAAGYDVRVARDASVPPGLNKVLKLSSGSFVLVATMEHFAMPRDVMGTVHDKSSWARRGLAVQNTVIEPGWRGYLTLELTNHGEDELFGETGDPIAQIVFQFLDMPTDQPYTGKYQDQKYGPQPAIEEK